MYPQLKIFPSPFCVNMRCPGHGQWMHSIFIFEQMGLNKTVLATGAGNEAVISTVPTAIPVAEIDQFLFPIIPVYDMPLLLCNLAGITYPFVIKIDCLLLAIFRVHILNRRTGPLI